MTIGQVNESDRRVRRTRKLLQDAFLALIAEKSFQSISVQDIARRADVNRATFYAHFADKYALFDYVVGEWFGQALATRVPAEAPFTLGNLHALTVAILKAVAEFHGHCKPSANGLDPLIVAKVQQGLEAFLLEWLRRAEPSELDPPVSPQTAATVLSWAIFGTGMTWSHEARTASADEAAREILAMLAGGVRRVVKLPARTNGDSGGRDKSRSR
ncbi:MAG: TetR/AcrR family transcriptional regulator [Chloroflexota bacterium]